jgi:hypothetical protein
MQIAPDSFDHRSKRLTPQILEDVVRQSNAQMTNFVRQFLLLISTSRGKPLCRLSSDRLDEMKAIHQKTLETLEKL